MNADRSSQTNITNNSAADRRPSWSPDGTKIAFDTNRDGQFEVYVMNPNGSSPTSITRGAGGADPEWSPTGSRIVFDGVFGCAGLCIMNADGSNPTVVNTGSLEDSDPSWSPDGTYLVFRSHRDFNDEIYRIRADGTTPAVRLTNNAPPGNTSPEDWFPSWQPVSTPPSPAGEFTSLTPARLLDTRPGSPTIDGLFAGGGAVGNNASIDVQVTGRGGVPAAAQVSAVVLNATITGPNNFSYLTAWPTGVSRPTISNLNYGPGQTVPNLVTVAVGSAAAR